MASSQVPDILARIVDSKREEVAALRPHAAELRHRARDLAPTRGFAAALSAADTVQLLAEIKRQSPSAGPIRPGANASEVARDYQHGGAAALSVLTDLLYFGGTLDTLREVREVVELPLLRKDFILDPSQVWEARVAGADAILLIVRILGDDQMASLFGQARELGMDVLVEVHDAEELARARAVGADLIGINNRDLGSFHTDLAVSFALAAEVPGSVTLVAESGIRTAEDVARLGAAGVDAILVGESLMRQPDIRSAAAALVGHPKHPRS